MALELKVNTVYADGVFDLFHPGHVAFLQKARAVGGPDAKLIVGVITDEDARWKRPPILTHAERLTMVSACRAVTFVVNEPPLVLTNEFLDEHNIDFVVHGDDDEQKKFFAVPIARGMMRYVPYTAGVSTSDIIARIKERR
jgi:cytidyltransferase-like protein